MDSFLPPFVAFALAFRLATLAISIRNERALKRAGSEEHGRGVSALLAAAHVAFYAAAIAEGFWRGAAFDALSLVGLLLYAFGAVMLLVVIGLLGRLWTVKLVIAADHRLVDHPLFRRVRHPNYYLNILPELVGLGLTLHAYGTLLVGLPVYLVPLILRIRQEERLMTTRFEGY